MRKDIMMRNDDKFEELNLESNEDGNNPVNPVRWIIMVITMILFFSAFVANGLQSAERTGSIADGSTVVSDSSTDITDEESIPASVNADTPQIVIVQSLTREANQYLVYPEKYEIELKSFPKEFSKEDKDELINALGRYAYEEGFKCELAEYASDLQANTADGFRTFGMCLNGMEDFYVTAVREPEQGEYLFIMDQRTPGTARDASPAETEDESQNRSNKVTGTPVPTVTKKPTDTPSPRPTATPIPTPTSDYQPDIIEIKGIPGEIADAIESPEELRDSLYNFMYDNDIRGSEITVEPYFEKYGDNIYDFELNVAGKTIYSRYDAGANEYYYSLEAFE